MAFVDRKRAINFSVKEETVLLSLVKKYHYALENKKRDTNVNIEKTECWQKIENEFNSMSSDSFRDAKVLRKKYENLKKKTKRKFADEKCYRLGTGGGPSKPIEVTDVDNAIKEILGTRMEGLTSEFGGDAIVFDAEPLPVVSNNSKTITPYQSMDHDYYAPSTSNVDQSNQVYVVESEVEIDDSENVLTEKQTKWEKYTPQMLRAPKSKELICSPTTVRKKHKSDILVGERLSQWAQAKFALEGHKQKYCDEEHVLKMQCVKEKHEEELRLLRLESEARIAETVARTEMRRAEHKIKMQILEIEKARLL